MWELIVKKELWRFFRVFMKNWSIGVKLALQITLVIVSVMAIIGVLGVYQQERKFTSILHARAEWVLQQLAINLEMPMWNLDDDQIDHILQSYLSDADILSIKVAEPESEQLIRHVAKDPTTLESVDFDLDAPREFFYADAFSRQAEIIHEEEAIGRLEIAFSRQFITSQRQETMAMMGIALLSLICVETLILLFLVKRKISDPLAANVQAATRIAQGDVDIQLPEIRSEDEIGSLNAAFHHMIAYLGEMAARAAQISTGDLRNKFVPKSREDVLGEAFLQMTRYLNEMAATATAISTGDLRQDVELSSQHDALGKAFQQMAFLRRIVSQIMDGSVQLETSSAALGQLSLQMADEAKRSSEQTHSISASSGQVSQHVTDTASSVNQSSVTIREIAANTRKVAEIANQAMGIAQEASDVIETLAVHSREIGKFVDIIGDVSQQTHLLALNASIEASRSGEAGRRFAVVAGEVKELAGKTAQAAEDINRRTQAIQSSSGESSEAIRQLSTIVQEVDVLTAVIADSVEQQNSTQQHISNNMASIAGSGEDISHTMTDIAVFSDHISERASSVQKAAQELTGISGKLQQVVEQFKI
jgi:methyl-accepting chemotaxis protein